MRFPEFSGEWEETTLGKISEITKGSGISKDQLSEQGSPCILYGELYTKYKSEVIGVVYSRTELESSSLVKSKANDVIIPCSGETAIDISTARCVPFNNILLGGDLNIIRLKHDDGGFFAYQLNGARKKDIARVAQGVSVVHLYGENLKHIRVNHPVIEEQKKITRLLSPIDERIAIQNKIIEKLESLIKGITDKLLCNFSWEKVYLRSFMEFYPTNSFSWEQLSYEKGTIRNLHYGLIHGISTKSVTTKTLPFISSNKADSRFVCCQNGDVAFADASEDTADIGKAVEFTDVDNTNVVCGLHTIHGRDVKELTIVGFKGFMFNSSYFHEQVRRVAQGTKVFSISANNLSSCYVYIPDKSEQTKITGLLYSMEMKISLSSKLLERYKIQKEYLLRQMFI